MELTEAKAFIRTALPARTSNVVWADLGCGSGLFTKALASSLGNGGKIYAVDKESQQIEFSEAGKQIEFVKLDFILATLPFFDIDGILMANALHYVRNKETFINKIAQHLKPDGTLIIIEYDTDKPNPWVPYPISFKKLHETFTAMGFDHVHKTGERKSIYRSGKMYISSVARQ